MFKQHTTNNNTRNTSQFHIACQPPTSHGRWMGLCKTSRFGGLQQGMRQNHTVTKGATRCPLPAPLYSEVGQPHGALYHNVFLKLTGMPSIGLTTSASWAPNSS